MRPVFEGGGLSWRILAAAMAAGALLWWGLIELLVRLFKWLTS